MDEGSVTPDAGVDRLIWAPPFGAAGLNDTVHKEDPPAEKLVGMQVKVDIVPVPEEEIAIEAALVTEPALALIIAVWVPVEVVVVAVNWTDLPLAATVTDAGTVTPVAVVDTLTAKPPVAAAELIDTVQIEEVPDAMLLGLQVKLERTGAVRATEAAFDDPL